MATVVVPYLMRDLTGGQVTVEAPGRTVRAVIDALNERYPGVRARLCDGDALAAVLTVAVDGKLSRLGLMQPVGEASEIRFLPAIEGG
jgi:sulfur-carrier protein